MKNKKYKIKRLQQDIEGINLFFNKCEGIVGILKNSKFSVKIIPNQYCTNSFGIIFIPFWCWIEAIFYTKCDTSLMFWCCIGYAPMNRVIYYTNLVCLNARIY